MVSNNYPSPRNVSFHRFVSLTYENTLSDSYGIIPAKKFIRPRYDLELIPRMHMFRFSEIHFPIDTYY